MPGLTGETALVLEEKAAACENWHGTPRLDHVPAVLGEAGYRRVAGLHGIIQESDK